MQTIKNVFSRNTQVDPQTFVFQFFQKYFQIFKVLTKKLKETYNFESRVGLNLVVGKT